MPRGMNCCGEGREIVQETGVGCHDHGRQGRVIGLDRRGCWGCRRGGGLVVGKDLVDAEGGVCKLYVRLVFCP